MLQDIPSSALSAALREAKACVIETERLSLRQPTLADVKAIARLASDRRIAENARRLPYPYQPDDAVAFIRMLAESSRETAFLIEHNHEPIGIVGLSARSERITELGYWLGTDYWGQGFGTEAARATIDYYFESCDAEHLFGAARVANPSSRNILEKCGFQWTGVELHRFEVLGSSAPVDAFRLARNAWLSLKNWANAVRREV